MACLVVCCAVVWASVTWLLSNHFSTGTCLGLHLWLMEDWFWVLMCWHNITRWFDLVSKHTCTNRLDPLASAAMRKICCANSCNACASTTAARPSRWNGTSCKLRMSLLFFKAWCAMRHGKLWQASMKGCFVAFLALIWPFICFVTSKDTLQRLVEIHGLRREVWVYHSGTV